MPSNIKAEIFSTIYLILHINKFYTPNIMESFKILLVIVGEWTVNLS